MDIGKIHSLISAFEGRRVNGQHIDVADRRLVDEIRAKPFLDRVDAHAFVHFAHMDSPTWERFQGCSGYEINDGALTILVGGNDADGDWGTTEIVCFPRGIWMKFETQLISVANPYFEAPVDAEEGESADG